MKAESATARAPRLAYLDGMRAAAAVYVVGFHVLGFTSEQLTGGARVLRRLFAFGHEAVAVFIVLSGYCLMLPVARSRLARLPTSVPTFLSRRAFRILPPYYAAVALSLLLLLLVAPLRELGNGPIWDQTLPGLEPFAIATHALLIHNWMPSVAYQINGPHWSVATEFQIYVVFCTLLLPLLRWRGPVALALFAAAVGYAPLLFAKDSSMIAAPWYLLLFVLGMSAAASSMSSSEQWPRLARVAKSPWLAAGLAVGCFGCGMFAATLWFRFKPLTDFAVGAATAAVLVQLGAESSTSGVVGRLRRWLESPPVVSIGRASYSLYLTHLPVLALCHLLLRPLTSSPLQLTLLLLGLGMGCSLLFAAAFYWLVERRFVRAARPATTQLAPMAAK